METPQILGALLVILLIAAVGIWSSRKVKTADDFATGGNRGSACMVTGMSLATLLGGACTIGTAQLAYQYGLAGWWYTLGTAAGCLVIAALFTGVYRHSGCQTMTGIIRREFGLRVDLTASFVLFAGLLLSLTSQLIAATAVLPFLFPGLDSTQCLLVTILLIVSIVFFGGSLSAGKTGEIKTLLLIAISLLGGAVVLRRLGMGRLWGALRPKGYFEMFARGTGNELGNFAATVLGVVCTQANVQAVLSAKDDRAARRGMAAGGVIVPVIGLCGVLIGMFMYLEEPSIPAAQALPRFVLGYLPKLTGGVAIGTLLITLVLSGAGTALGCAVILTDDVIRPLVKQLTGSGAQLACMRACVLATLLLAALLGSGVFGDTILNFSFLAMALRAVSLIVPFLCAVYFPGKVDRRFAWAGSVVGPAAVLVFGVWPVLPVDEIFAGIFACAVCCAAGAAVKKREKGAMENV